jgi:hypothetical protein
MPSLADVLGAVETLPFGAMTVPIKPLSLRDFGDLEAWINTTQLPDPLAVVRRHIDAGGVPAEQCKYLYAEALKTASQRRIRLGTPEAQEYLYAFPAMAWMLRRAAARVNPLFTDEDAWTAVNQAASGELARLLEVVQLPMMLMLDTASDPKDGAAGT